MSDKKSVLIAGAIPTKRILQNKQGFIGNGLQMGRQIGISAHREERFGDGGQYDEGGCGYIVATRGRANVLPNPYDAN
jgi:hypothetical protein